jgi:hypothetical protein
MFKVLNVLVPPVRKSAPSAMCAARWLPNGVSLSILPWRARSRHMTTKSPDPAITDVVAKVTVSRLLRTLRTAPSPAGFNSQSGYPMTIVVELGKMNVFKSSFLILLPSVHVSLSNPIINPNLFRRQCSGVALTVVEGSTVSMDQANALACSGN